MIDLFHYIPNRALAILAAALFGGVSILILIVMLVKRRQYFMLVVTFCGLAECACPHPFLHCISFLSLLRDRGGKSWGGAYLDMNRN